MSYKIHILGAAGAGTTTLGKALAERLNVAYFDSDDFYWQPTAEPFTVARLRDERTRLLQEQSADLEGWVLSGSVCGWGDAMIAQFTHVTFLRVDPHVRLHRLQLREIQRYGERVLEGGSRHENSVAFLAWAARYEGGNHSLRSLRRHESWLKPLTCPVIRLDSTHHSAEALVNQLMPLLNSSAAK
ncbi:AAA family ATPase [Pseudomonas antarctica]|uniref:Adenylate kinase n=1 Tax=Pseudomonas antarctica TaxID=219572 RepID=A0A1G9Y4Y3_9PSED|nr:AAA family ATPase [Pseudomonas antarctica]KAF2410340.1 shikimate kinase [Pseudomonas antarctica]SDN03525.1 Adenylate kinase [Pseudomonas antarctica]